MRPSPRRLGSLLALPLTFLLAAAGPAAAQEVSAGSSLNLSDMLTRILRDGILLAPPTGDFPSHEAHFVGAGSAQFGAVEEVNRETGWQIALTPLGSSAGGFAYQYDPSLGVFTRPTSTFGSVYAERPLTIGKGKINLGINYTRFDYDYLDGLNLRNGDVKLVFTHIDTNHDGSNLTPFFEGDLVTAVVYMNIKSQTTDLVATYGVSDRLDVGVAIPEVTVDMDVAVDAKVDRLASGATAPDIHRFQNGTDQESFAQSGHASGLGDVTVRGKYRAVTGGLALLSMSGEVRLPTGDQYNLLGAGALQATGTLLGSLNWPKFSPHATLGYTLSAKGLTDLVTYTAGFDWAADPKLTLFGDALGRYYTDLQTVSVVPETYTYNAAPDSTVPVVATATFPRLTTGASGGKNTIYVSGGFKLNVVDRVVFSAAGLVPLQKHGLQDPFSVLFGVDYSY